MVVGFVPDAAIPLRGCFMRKVALFPFSGAFMCFISWMRREQKKMEELNRHRMLLMLAYRRTTWLS